MSERSYHFEERVGAGGHGVVYRARYRGEGKFEQHFAVKILDEAGPRAPELGARLRDEGRLLTLARHRALVDVHDVVTLVSEAGEERLALVMAWVPGVDLEELLRRTRALPTRAAFELVGEVAGALRALTTARGADGREIGMVHRDIKPANIRLTPRGEVKLLDFGIARAQIADRESLTRDLILGTPGYAAPERTLGEPDLPSGDVYSLGVVLFEVLAARALGAQRDLDLGHDAWVRSRLRGLEDSRDDMPGRGRRLLERMLAARPEARPAAAEVEEEARAIAAVAPDEGLAQLMASTWDEANGATRSRSVVHDPRVGQCWRPRTSPGATAVRPSRRGCWGALAIPAALAVLALVLWASPPRPTTPEVVVPAHAPPHVAPVAPTASAAQSPEPTPERSAGPDPAVPKAPPPGGSDKKSRPAEGVRGAVSPDAGEAPPTPPVGPAEPEPTPIAVQPGCVVLEADDGALRLTRKTPDSTGATVFTVPARTTLSLEPGTYTGSCLRNAAEFDLRKELTISSGQGLMIGCKWALGIDELLSEIACEP